MTKTASSELKAELAANLSTIATCWRILRTDSQEFFFTDHDIDLVVDGDIYEAASGMLPTGLSQNRGLAVDNMEVVAFLESDKIDEAEINARLFDYATVDIFLVNHADLTQGKLYLAQDWQLGAVEIRDNAVQVEIRSKAGLLAQNITAIYSPDCRADLGDSQCGIDLADSAQTYWGTGAVTSMTDNQTFIDSSRSEATDVFRYGKITWSTPGSADTYLGNNAGLEMEIKSFNPATKEFVLFEAMPYEISVDDEYTVTYGCDKSKATCRDRFDNVVNFRGEPFIPGFDKMMDYRR